MEHDSASYPDHAPLIEKENPPCYEEGEQATVPEKSSAWKYLAFTLPFFGLQLAWTVQQVFGVPYLSTLGVPNTQMPIFVLSGPLAGLIGPPCVAALSDTDRSLLGKWKPLIFFGGGTTIVSFLLLAAAEPLALSLTYSLGLSSPNAAGVVSRMIAGVSIYSLNLALQPLQLGLRASVVDNFSPEQQPVANLWINRFSALGSAFVTFVALVYSPVFWNLTIVVASILAMLLGIVAFTITGNHTSPRTRHGDAEFPEPKTTLKWHVSQLLKKASKLPPVTRYTCRVQIVSWFAWFLVLHYTSSLVAQIDQKAKSRPYQSNFADAPPTAPAKAVSVVALLFHTAALATLMIASITWRNLSSRDFRTTGTSKGDGSFHSWHHSVATVWTQFKMALITWPTSEEKPRQNVDAGSSRPCEPSVIYTKESAYLADLGSASSVDGDCDSATGTSQDDQDEQVANDIPCHTEMDIETAPPSDGKTERTRDTLMRRVWKSSLLGLSFSLLLACLMVWLNVATVTTISLVLSANGIFFALASWVPYTLIASEARTLRETWAQAQPSATENVLDGQDETLILLAIHNMAITIPQIVASVASWVLMQWLKLMGIEQDVLWIFWMCIPVSLCAAFL